MNCENCKKNNNCKYQITLKEIGITEFKCSHYTENKKYKAFNINCKIKFKINPKAEEEICNYWAIIYNENMTLDKLFGKPDEEGYRACQTWTFIEYIGPFIKIGEPPIETTVYFESKNLY